MTIILTDTVIFMILTYDRNEKISNTNISNLPL